MGRLASAAVLRGRDQPFSIEEIELPALGHGQMLVRIVGVGVCHTDLLPREGHLGDDLAIVLGHEGAGIVEELGPGVTGVHTGDHVVLTFDSCGACANCLSGHPAYCDTFAIRNFIGVGLGDVPSATSRKGGTVATRWFGQSSFADYVVVTTRNAVVIDRELPLELAGPLGCSVTTGAATVANVLGVGPRDSVAVLGAGSVGLAGVMMAASSGAGRIVAVDLDHSRLELAGSFGATHQLGSAEAGELTESLLATGGPLSAVLDTTGNPRTIAAAVDALAPRGTCAVVGHQREELVLGPRALSGGKRVTAVYEGDVVPQVDIPRLASLWAQGKLPFDRLIETYALAAINDAEHDLESARVVKPILLP